MKIICIGLGEIGKAIYEVVSDRYSDVYTKDTNIQTAFKVDIIHICYPYSYDFVRVTNDYITDYKPCLAIIHSTVPLGTCEKLSGLVVHCPIRGRHQNLVDSIKSYEMFMGYASTLIVNRAEDYLKSLGIKVRTIPSFEATELAKLLSLVQYAYNIEFARYADKCCKKYNIDYSVIRNYTDTYNEVVEKLEGSRFIKSNLDPPEGKIGGHCVLPALEVMNDRVPNKAIQSFLEVNKKFQE